MKTKSFAALALLFILVCCACDGKKVNHDDKAPVDKYDKTYPKLFLLSAGLTTDTLKSAFLNYLDKEPGAYSVGVVVNASTTDKKKRKKTKKIKAQFSEIGFDSTKIESFDLMMRNPEELAQFDIIYILGGNPFLLLEEVKKSGAYEILKKLATQDKILMGYSAGSLLLGPGLALMDHADSLLGFNEIGLKELDGLGLYDFHIFPHYSDFTGQVPELITNINQFEERDSLKVYRINDNQGIIYRQGKIEIIGK